MRIVSWSALLLCLGVLCVTAMADTSVMLVIRPVTEEFFEDAQDGGDPELSAQTDELIVIGTLDAPAFSVEGIDHIALSAPDRSLIPLTIDQSSLYSEFDDGVYNSMRVLFNIPAKILEQGTLRLSWGEEISAHNRQVERIRVYLEEQERYRTFTWEAQPAGDEGGSYASTLEVIVDDYADTYYLWYLFPMAVIFILLFVKKVALR